MTEPAERLQFVFRLALQSTVEFTLLRRGWRAAVRQQAGCFGTRGSCGRKESGGEIQQEQDIYNICCDERYHVSLQCLRSRNVILVPNTGDTASPERACLQKCLQNDSSDSTSPPVFLPAPKTNSRNTMSARRTNKKSSNRVANSALVAISNDAASCFACNDRLILSAARESLLHCDGSSISGGPTSNW